MEKRKGRGSTSEGQPGTSLTPHWGVNGDSAPACTASSLPRALRDKYTSTRAAGTAPNQPVVLRLGPKAAGGEKC